MSDDHLPARNTVLASLQQLLPQPAPPPEAQPLPLDAQAQLALEGRLDRFQLPPGAADATAYQDFVSYVLGPENAYAIAIDDEPDPCVPVAHLAFAASLDRTIKKLQAKNYDVGPLEELKNLGNNLHPKQKIQAMGCVMKHLTKIAPPEDDDAIDLDKIEELGHSVDGLIDVEGYDFDIFQPDTINVGLRLIYRQEWTPLRYQVGELLHTIPLAPGEKVKYETKTWYTSKTVEEVNDTTTFTTEEVRSTTRRDVVEVMKATTTKFGVKVEANGAANIGPAQVGGSSSASADHQRESRRAKQKFQEYMSKSAETLRNERRVAVSVTREQGSESRMTREVSNPNDEITVSYLFYELQRVYAVRQWLFNVVPVVYVAHYVPPAKEITDDWIILHDWILAGAILDKSFLEPLTFVSNELPDLLENYGHAKKVYTQAKEVVDAVKRSISDVEHDIDNEQGIGEIILRIQLKSLNDRLKHANESLHKADDKLRIARKAYKAGAAKVQRLRAHIQQNILHYMQAIWNTEVPEQRYLRLRSLPYPNMVRAGDNLVLDQNTPWVSLGDVADLMHPAGYLGNYVIFELCRDEDALATDLMSHYVGPDDYPADPDAENPDEAILQIVTPAEAVHVEALPGTHPLLEEFKRQHRAVDVEKARQEAISLGIENLRRAQLLVADRYGDPSVEKLIVGDTDLLRRLGQLPATPDP